MKRQKENSHEGITWSEMGKQNVQAKEVYLHNNRTKRKQPPFMNRVYCTLQTALIEIVIRQVEFAMLSQVNSGKVAMHISNFSLVFVDRALFLELE